MHIEEMVAAARGREKAEIGLPPGLRDIDAAVVYLIGTKAFFKANPIELDQVFQTDADIMAFDFPTEQTLGTIEDQPVIKIVIPDVKVPVIVERMDTLKGIVEKLIYVGSWLFTRRFNTLVVNHVILQIQLRRLKRAKIVALGEGPTRFRAAVRVSRITESIATRTARQARLVRRFKSPLRIVGRVATRALLRAFLIVGLIIDIIIISVAVIQGTRRAGIPGALGAFAGGVADTVTFGLVTPATETLAEKVEQGARDDPRKLTRFFALGGRI